MLGKFYIAPTWAVQFGERGERWLPIHAYRVETLPPESPLSHFDDLDTTELLYNVGWAVGLTSNQIPLKS